MSFRRYALQMFPAGLAPVLCVAAMILTAVHWHYIVLTPHIPEGEYNIEVKVDPKWGRDYTTDATIQIRHEDDYIEDRNPDRPGRSVHHEIVYLTEILWESGRKLSINDTTVQPGESVEVEEPLILEDVMQEYDSLFFDLNFDDNKRLDYLDNIIQDAYLRELSDSAVAAYEEQTVTVPLLTPELLGVTKEDKIQSIGRWSIAEHILVFVCALFVFTPFTRLLPEWARAADMEACLEEYDAREAAKKKKD